MAKGFSGCAAKLDEMGAGAENLTTGLSQLSLSLMEGIGGSMGPLYGAFFTDLADEIANHEQLDSSLFSQALTEAVARVQSMANAKPGDKTLMDVLVPARDAFNQSVEKNEDFAAALSVMAEASRQGRDSTRDMQAKIGRSARLGECSIGVVDAGATSCSFILCSLADSLQVLLREQSQV